MRTERFKSWGRDLRSKPLLLVLALCLAQALLLSFETKPVVASSTNLVRNPGFENGLDNWDPFQYASGWSSSNNPHSGLLCARFSFPAGSGYYDASIKSSGYQIYVEAGVPYLFSFWIRENDTHDTYNSNMTIVDPGVVLNSTWYGAPQPPPSESWQSVSTIITFPENGYAVIHFELHGYATSNLAEFAVDDVVLEEKTTWEGMATFKLKTLYKVDLYKDNLWLNWGKKLVLKFYTYENTFENENVIHENFTLPWKVVPENENVLHPSGIGIKRARLDLTGDNTENVISTIASFTVTKTILEVRFTQIPLEWSLAPPAEKIQLEIEFSEIPLYWALAPS